MEKKLSHVLFDFDGVIVQSFDMILQTVREFNDPNLTADEFRTWSYGNVHDSKGIRKDEDFRDFSVEPGTFFHVYRERLLNLQPMEGIREIIEHLAVSHELAIVSSSLSRPIQDYLVQENLDQYFNKVYGVDVHPSKEVKITKILEECQTQPQEVLFITDTLGDIKEATTVQVPSIGVTWGFHSKETLEEGSPFGIATTIDELSSLLKQL